MNILVVALGSALGGALRYLVSLWTTSKGWIAFPWATLIVNIAGCFAIMLIVTIAASVAMPANLRLFLTTGIMGGLTTYSTFDFETTRFFQDGTPGLGILYIGATLVTCFIAGLLGLGLARLVVGSPA
jgi:CrcB protein